MRLLIALIIDLSFDMKMAPAALTYLGRGDPAGLKIDYQSMWKMAKIKRIHKYDDALVLEDKDKDIGLVLLKGDRNQFFFYREIEKRKIQGLCSRRDPSISSMSEYYRGWVFVV